MRISEVYVSIQGEAEHAGEETVFIRLTGCNLRCAFCDTPYTSWEPAGIQRPWRDVLDEALAADVRFVDITGGEPLLQPDVVSLSHALREAGRHVTIETAGTVYRPVSADLVAISPKRPNSTPEGRWNDRHEARRDVPAVIARFLAEHRCLFKFVIDQPTDFDDVANWLKSYPQIEPDQIWVMPQAVEPEALAEKSAWIQERARRRGWRFSPRLHIALFGNVRGR